MDSPKDQWREFLRQCFMRRVDVRDFLKLYKLLQRRCIVSELVLLDLLFAAQAESHVKFDPLLPLYIDSLCKLGELRISTVLAALLEHSSIHEKPGASSFTEAEVKAEERHGEQQSQQPFCTLMTDIKVVQDMTLSISTGAIPLLSADVLAALLLALADWINAIISWNNSSSSSNSGSGLDEEQEQQSSGLMSSPNAISLFESLGILLSALAGTTQGATILSSNGYESGSSSSNLFPLARPG